MIKSTGIKGHRYLVRHSCKARLSIFELNKNKYQRKFEDVHEKPEFRFQAFIQAVLLVSVFEQRLSFRLLFHEKRSGNHFKMRVGVWRCCKLFMWHSPWKCFCIFTSGEQRKSLKKKKPSKLVHFKCKFDATLTSFKMKFYEDWFWKLS